MGALSFDTEPRTSKLGKWVMHDRNCHTCGNVMVRNLGGVGCGQESWVIYVQEQLDDKGHWTWKRVSLKRHYVHAGAAKVASRLIGNNYRKGKTS